MRRADWERLGGMDEQFFLWFEDVDLSARVARAGGTVAIAQDVSIRHVGASTWTLLPRRRRQWLRLVGARRFAAKHLGRGAAAAITAAGPAALAIGVTLDIAHWITRRP
jgi:GT2 family glycosyltransferase